MTDLQLRDEVMTMFLAGHETTANALAWTLLLLGRHPEIMAWVQAELDTVLGGRTPTLEDLGALTYLGQVVDEGMRLYPPAWLIARSVEESDYVSSCAGQVVVGDEVRALAIYEVFNLEDED